LPCATQLGTCLLIAPNTSKTICFRSANLPKEERDVPLHSLNEIPKKQHWSNYPLGVIQQFAKKGYTLETGLDILFWGNLPVGAGLSSSASIELAMAIALQEYVDSDLSKWDLAHIGMYAEHEAVGVKCGILDQFAVAFGEKNHALLLDCHQLQHEKIPCILENYCFVLVDSVVPRSLVNSAYNTRFRECQTALTFFQTIDSNIQYLSQVPLYLLEKHESKLTPSIYKRAKHIISAQSRTPQAAQYLRQAAWENFGQLMFASHESLSNDYEVSGKYLDTLVRLSKSLGSLGARMTGAGFGGCTVHLIHKDDYNNFSTNIIQQYKAITQLEAKCHLVSIEDGARRL